MNAPLPDERFSAAARDALVAMVEQGREAAISVAKPRRLVQGLTAAAVLTLVVAVSALVLARSGFRTDVARLTAPTATGSSIPVPGRLSCGAGQQDAYAPFGCGNFVATDGRGPAGAVAWLHSRPIDVQFYWKFQADEPEMSVGAPCNGLGSVPVRLTTTTISADISKGFSALPFCDSAARALDRQAYAFFTGPISYSIEGNELTLEHGGTVVHFHRVPLPSPTPVP